MIRADLAEPDPPPDDDDDVSNADDDDHNDANTRCTAIKQPTNHGSIGGNNTPIGGAHLRKGGATRFWGTDGGGGGGIGPGGEGPGVMGGRCECKKCRRRVVEVKLEVWDQYRRGESGNGNGQGSSSRKGSIGDSNSGKPDDLYGEKFVPSL